MTANPGRLTVELQGSFPGQWSKAQSRRVMKGRARARINEQMMNERMGDERMSEWIDKQAVRT